MNNWAGSVVDWLIEWVMFLPLTVGNLFQSRLIRAVFFMVGVLWALPGILVCGILSLPFIFLEMGIDYVSSN